MPFVPSDSVKKTKKVAGKPKAQAQWSAIANSLLAAGKPEDQAIREANGVVKKRAAGGA